MSDWSSDVCSSDLALNHETVDDTVENRIVVVSALGVVGKVLDRDWSLLFVQLKFNRSEISLYCGFHFMYSLLKCVFYHISGKSEAA